MYKILFLLLSFGSIIFSGCSSTRITTAWKDPNSTHTNYKKIMVVGLMNGIKRMELRERMENHLADDLKNRGYEVNTSFREYGPSGLKGKTENEIIDLMRKEGYDAILTVALLDIEKERNYVQGYVEYWPGGIYYSRFGRYYYYWYDRIYQPGYYVSNTTYLIEGNLFDTKLDKLVFSAQTESFNPGTADKLGHQLSQSLLDEMSRKGMLQPIIK
jgi:hypothetical protein